jgi:hypothetical protein
VSTWHRIAGAAVFVAVLLGAALPTAPAAAMMKKRHIPIASESSAANGPHSIGDVLAPTSGTIIGREIVYPNGIMLSLDGGTGLPSPDMDPSLAAPAAVIACSAGYTCLYEHRDYGGRRLQWRDVQLINLNDYGFNDKMSSWRNRNSRDARWYHDVGGRGTSRCMQAGASVSYVGSGDNDRASSLRIYSSSTAC